MFKSIKPTQILSTIILSLSINNLPTLLDHKYELSKIGEEAAKDAEKEVTKGNRHLR